MPGRRLMIGRLPSKMSRFVCRLAGFMSIINLISGGYALKLLKPRLLKAPPRQATESSVGWVESQQRHRQQSWVKTQPAWLDAVDVVGAV